MSVLNKLEIVEDIERFQRKKWKKFLRKRDFFFANIFILWDSHSFIGVGSRLSNLTTRTSRTNCQGIHRYPAVRQNGPQGRLKDMIFKGDPEGLYIGIG